MRLSLITDLADYREQMRRIPGFTGEEAKRAAKRLTDRLKRGQRRAAVTARRAVVSSRRAGENRRQHRARMKRERSGRP